MQLAPVEDISELLDGEAAPSWDCRTFAPGDDRCLPGMLDAPWCDPVPSIIMERPCCDDDMPA